MGLILSVYRPADFGECDCTNGGISASHDRLTVTNVDGPFDPSPDAPAVYLEKGPLGAIRLKSPTNDGRWTMFGGNYAGTSDSRFNDAVERLIGYRAGVVPIHDRVE